jgi:hypothetical protein
VQWNCTFSLRFLLNVINGSMKKCAFEIRFCHIISSMYRKCVLFFCANEKQGEMNFLNVYIFIVVNSKSSTGLLTFSRFPPCSLLSAHIHLSTIFNNYNCYMLNSSTTSIVPNEWIWKERLRDKMQGLNFLILCVNGF